MRTISNHKELERELQQRRRWDFDSPILMAAAQDCELQGMFMLQEGQAAALVLRFNPDFLSQGRRTLVNRLRDFGHAVYDLGSASKSAGQTAERGAATPTEVTIPGRLKQALEDVGIVLPYGAAVEDSQQAFVPVQLSG